MIDTATLILRMIIASRGIEEKFENRACHSQSKKKKTPSFYCIVIIAVHDGRSEVPYHHIYIIIEFWRTWYCVCTAAGLKRQKQPTLHKTSPPHEDGWVISSRTVRPPLRRMMMDTVAVAKKLERHPLLLS